MKPVIINFLQLPLTNVNMGWADVKADCSKSCSKFVFRHESVGGGADCRGKKSGTPVGI